MRAMEFKEVLFVKVSPETKKHNRRFFERQVKRMFIKFLAYTHQLDGVLSEEEIARPESVTKFCRMTVCTNWN